MIAHPAAIALAMLLAKLVKVTPVRRSVVHIFEPASERGQRGMDELQQQTVALLAFQKLKTDVFDAQLGFNLLARYGEEALERLELIEQRVERHLASLLAAWPGIPMPSLRMIQAPVFHGHSFSVWAEFENNLDAAAPLPARWPRRESTCVRTILPPTPPSPDTAESAWARSPRIATTREPAGSGWLRIICGWPRKTAVAVSLELL